VIVTIVRMVSRNDRVFARLEMDVGGCGMLRVHPRMPVREAVAPLGKEDPDSHQEGEADGWTGAESGVAHQLQT
jgi:hypothetical protein